MPDGCLMLNVVKFDPRANDLRSQEFGLRQEPQIGRTNKLQTAGNFGGFLLE